MGFQYNGKLRSAELLLEEDGSVKEIRRAETLDDYFATLDFAGLRAPNFFPPQAISIRPWPRFARGLTRSIARSPSFRRAPSQRIFRARS
jgi:hypothetical protein